MENVKFECEHWEGRPLVRSIKRIPLQKQGKFWRCPECGASYGSDEDMKVPFSPFDYVLVLES